VETGTVRIVELDDRQRMSERLIEGATSYTVHADGTLAVFAAGESISLEFWRWADVKFSAP
jgi:hypothetical protein